MNAPNLIADAATALQLLATGLFAGGAMMEMMVEHPARLSADHLTARDQMRRVLDRADPLMPGLATVALFSGLAAFWRGGEWAGLAGGVLAGLNILFTLVAILPSNKTLLAFEDGDSPTELKREMRRWQRLHAVRTVAALVAFGLVAVGRLPTA